MARLMNRMDLEARSESLDQRLDVCTELYEGATDRVADYRWYRSGHRLEMTIVWLLIVEILFLAADFGFRNFECYHAE